MPIVNAKPLEFEYRSTGITGKIFDLYQRGGENYLCVEGQTGTNKLRGRQNPGNAILGMLQPVAQVRYDCGIETTASALERAIRMFIKLFHPASFTFIASKLGNPDGRLTYLGKVRTSFPRSPLRARVDEFSFLSPEGFREELSSNNSPN